ncbi:DUF397 domain-containing protein [Saccharopolyspora sp. HNM0986]|uniref:DUF397 domain-containing protein n=1 Tax=Saccharopolyspora galaxeae TaxID=2781241 RepID=UPI001909439E|nr:DUF397 domain-containing protein [Saccharopolyspora sp. HNM0986]MBK0870871.1 DUF397 domain-containing protein [Saccharopolyspora sp. HNM0986]
MDQHPTWRKSTYSGNLNECVELAVGVDGPAVRDSKLGESGPVLRLDAAAFASFLDAVKAGRHDR